MRTTTMLMALCLAATTTTGQTVQQKEGSNATAEKLATSVAEFRWGLDGVWKLSHRPSVAVVVGVCCCGVGLAWRRVVL